MIGIWYGHFIYENNVNSLALYLTKSSFLFRETESSLASRDFLKAAENPSLWFWVNKLSDRFSSLNENVRLRWFVDYVMYPPSGMLLSVGILGILFIQLQLFLISSTRKTVLETASAEIQTSSDVIVSAIKTAAYDVLNPYITDANSRIAAVEDELNQVIFGWADESVKLINDTSNSLKNGFNDVLSSVFTAVPPLKTAVEKFINCLLGSAIESFISIGEMMKNSSQISFPRVDSRIGDISPDSIRDAADLSNKLSLKFSNSSSEQDSNAFVFEEELDTILSYYRKSLGILQMAFFVALSLGGAGLLIGAIVVLVDMLL
jgi:hypothetical protein